MKKMNKTTGKELELRYIKNAKRVQKTLREENYG